MLCSSHNAVSMMLSDKNMEWPPCWERASHLARHTFAALFRLGFHQFQIYNCSAPGLSILTVDSSSLTNEKDHHYFLNSADVCW